MSAWMDEIGSARRGPEVPFGRCLVVDDVPLAFAEAFAGAFTARPTERWVVALSGGPTARRCYETLASRPSEVVWPEVTVLMGDERCVDADDPDANQLLVKEALLNRVPPVRSFLPMSKDEPAEAYGLTVEREGPIDMIHLGLGPDGHTASMFPGSPDLKSNPGTLVVRTHDPNARNPHERISLTFEAINSARIAVFTVSGPEKHEAFARICAGEDLPAARVNSSQVLWLVDAAASLPLRES